MGRVVVLLGAPGSGKSSVGEELGRLGLRWREWEPELLARWGGREQFLANKAQALAELHGEMLAWADSDTVPAVIESTGLSDSAFIDQLQSERPDTMVVRLDVSADEALRRVAAREHGRHLSDDAERNRATWRAFAEVVVPQRNVDLAIDTVDSHPGETARVIVSLLGRPLPADLSAS